MALLYAVLCLSLAFLLMTYGDSTTNEIMSFSNSMTPTDEYLNKLTASSPPSPPSPPSSSLSSSLSSSTPPSLSLLSSSLSPSPESSQSSSTITNNTKINSTSGSEPNNVTITTIRSRTTTAKIWHNCNTTFHYPCGNGRCIPDNKVNDTVNDCGDNTDEVNNLRRRQCRGGAFACPTGNPICIPSAWALNDDCDCDDCHDEIHLIGYNCSRAPRCDEYINDSVCLEDICQCRLGYQSGELGKSCYRRTLNSTCKIDIDCYTVINNSVCLSDKCVCKTGYYRNGEDLCIPRIIGDACTQNYDCDTVIQHSICREQFCRCHAGFIDAGDFRTCRQRVIGDADCLSPQDCSTAIAQSTCLNQTCVCEVGYISDMNATHCRARILGDIGCHSNDVECSVAITHAVCRNDVCDCRTGYRQITNEFNDTSCVSRILGDTCTDDIDCVAVINNSSCDVNICQCSLGYIANGTNACRKMIIGDTCVLTSQCQQVNAWSQCNAMMGRCECGHGYKPDNDNVTCHIRQLGDPCEHNVDCLIDGGHFRCVDDWCRCSNEVNDSKTAEYDCPKNFKATRCHRHDDCTELQDNAYCWKNECSCRPGYHTLDMAPYSCKSRIIGDNCTDEVDCFSVIQNSLCAHERCACVVGYMSIKNDTQCRKRMTGDPCERHSDCAMDHGMCDEDICSCDSGFISTNDRTACRAMVVGDIGCRNTTDCTVNIPNSTCHNSTCLCRSGHVSQHGGASCRPRVLGDESGCQNDIDCSSVIGNGICLNETCTCAKGYFAPNGVIDYCVMRMLGDRCAYHGDCLAVINNSSCTNDTCQCDVGFTKEDDRRCRQMALGDICQLTDECLVWNDWSTCHSHRCDCDRGYLSSDYITCRRRLLGDKCTIREDCSIRDVPIMCTQEKVCSCMNTSHHFDNNYCEFVSLTTTCSVDDDCLTALGVQCDNRTCICSTGFISNLTLSTCTPRTIDDACATDADCNALISNSICFNNTCSCVIGYYYNVTYRRCVARRLEDACFYDSDCSAVLPGSECFLNTCRCSYGFMRVDSSCEPRPTLMPYKPLATDESWQPVFCNITEQSRRTGRDDGWCNEIMPHSACAEDMNGNALCRCLPGYVHSRLGDDCYRYIAYTVTINITGIAGTYDILLLSYSNLLLSNETTAFAELAERIEKSGMDVVMRSTQLNNDYLGSKVIRMWNAFPGIMVEIAIYFQQNATIATSFVEVLIHEEISRRDGEFGLSRLFPTENGSVIVEDLNECKETIPSPGNPNVTIPLHDCSRNAICFNIIGTFNCVCNLSYIDQSADQQNFPGRKCTSLSKIKLRLTIAQASCTDNRCETSWNMVAAILFVIFALLLVLLITEIIWKKKNYGKTVNVAKRRASKAVIFVKQETVLMQLENNSEWEMSDSDHLTYDEDNDDSVATGNDDSVATGHDDSDNDDSVITDTSVDDVTDCQSIT